MELEWLAAQRTKRGEKSKLMMSSGDKNETEKQLRTEKRREADAEAERKRLNKAKEEEERLLEDELAAAEFMAELEEVDGEGNNYIPPSSTLKEEEMEARKLVEAMLEEQLGDKAWLVVRYLGWPGPKRNTMTICNTAQASIRFGLAKPS